MNLPQVYMCSPFDSLILLLLGCLSCFWFLAIRIKDSTNVLARDLFGTLFSALKIWPLSLDLHRFDYDVHTLLCFTFYMASGLLMSLVVWVDIFIIVRIFLAIISSVILFCPIISFLSYWDFKHTLDYLIYSHRTQLLCSFIFSLFSPSCFSIANFPDVIQSDISKYKWNPIVFLLNAANNTLFHLQ